MPEGTSLISPSTETPTQVETRRVNPIQALFIELDSLNVTLLRVLEAISKQVPQGRVFPISRTVSAETIREDIVPAWISFRLVNDGPDALHFAVNVPQAFSVLPRRESIEIDMVEPIIERIFLRADTDESANARLYGVY